MHKLKLILFLVSMFVMLQNIKAQIPLPNGDSAWIYQASLSDEFDTSALRTYKWNPNYWDGYSISNGAEVNYTSNLIFNSSTLKIKADTLAPNYYESDTNKLWYKYNTPGQGLTFAYQGGVIQSKAASYKYGHLEISAKFPSKKYPLWPAFWLFNSNCTQGSDFLNEIDIAENAAPLSYQGNLLGTYYHISDDTCDYDYALNGGPNNTVLASNDSLSGAFHKFYLEWDPHNVVWYFDDTPILKLYDASGTNTPQNAMKLILNFCVDPFRAILPADWNGPKIQSDHIIPNPRSWPQFFEIEYVRYYKLGTECSTDLSNLCTPSGYNRKVKKSITTDATCTPTFNPGTAAGSYTLRATDYILLNEGTTINPSGTGYFAIELTPCPQ